LFARDFGSCRRIVRVRLGYTRHTLQTLRVVAAAAAAAVSVDDDEDKVAYERKADYECGAGGKPDLAMELGATYTAVGSMYYMAARSGFLRYDLQQVYQSHLPNIN
jgi:hypothetical protein